MLIIGLIAAVAALLMLRPAPQTQVISVPMPVEEERGGLGCAPLIVVGVVALLVIVGCRGERWDASRAQRALVAAGRHPSAHAAAMGADQVETAWSWDRLADTLFAQGQIDQARACSEQAPSRPRSGSR